MQPKTKKAATVMDRRHIPCGVRDSTRLLAWIAVVTMTIAGWERSATARKDGDQEASAKDVSSDLPVDRGQNKPAKDPGRGLMLYQHRCATCHGASGHGDGPTARHLAPPPTNLTRGIFKVRSTPEGSSPTHNDLFRTITRGIPGTAMPGWMGLSSADRWQLVFHVASLAPNFAAMQAGPLSIPKPLPPTMQSLERGRAIYAMLQCTQCHGDEGRGDGPSSLELKDDFGNRVYPFNFSRSGKFKGGSTPRDLYRTIHTGLGGTPMKSYHEMLTDRDTWALVNFIRSLRVDTPRPAIVAEEVDVGDTVAGESAGEGSVAKSSGNIRQRLDEMKNELAEQQAVLKQLLAASSSDARQAADKAASERQAKNQAEQKKAEQQANISAAKTARRHAAKKAREFYRTRCAACHGARGLGDGPAAVALTPRPRDLSDPLWQKEVGNSAIEQIIVSGGAAVGKSPLMPPNPDLKENPALVKQLRRLIRGLARK